MPAIDSLKGISKTYFILLQSEEGRDEISKKIVFRDALKFIR